MSEKRGMSPIISGVKRANRILITPNDFSSGIKAFEPEYGEYKLITIKRQN